MATIADTVIDRLSSSILALAKDTRESAEEMQEIFSEKRPFLFMDKEGDLRKRKIMREKEYEKSKQSVKAAGELAIALQKLNDDYATNATTLNESTEAVKNALAATQDFSDAMTTVQQNTILNAQNILSSGGDLRTEMGSLMGTTQEVGSHLSDMADKQKVAVQQADKFQRSLIDMRNTVYDTVKSMASVKTGVALAVVGFKKSFDDLEYSLKNQVPIMNTLSGSIADTAAMYGVSTRALMEVQNEHTIALLSASRGVGGLSGSATFALDEFDRLRKTLHNVTGDYDDALKLYGQLREAASFAGVAYSAEEFNKAMDGQDGLINSMKTLAAVTKTSIEEIAKMSTAIMKDRDIRFTMLGLDNKQRKNRAQEIIDYQTLLVSKGMEAEQAYEAAMALEKMNAQISPKERLKQAAKLRGVAGALGVAGGEKAFARAMKPPSQWTKTEQEENRVFATEMEKKQGKLAGGGIPAQMLGGALQDAMGGDLYNTMVKAQSTAGLEQREISDKTLQEIRGQTNQLQGAQDELLAMKKMFERVVAWGSDAGVFLAGGMAATMGAIFLQASMANKYLAAIAAKQGVPPIGGKFGKVAGGIAKGAGMLGAAAMVGKDVYDITQGENNKENVLAIAGGVVGGVVGMVGGPAGVAIGASIGNSVGEQMGIFWDNKIKEDLAMRETVADKLKGSETPELAELAKALKTQSDLSKEQTELYKKQIELMKEGNKVTKENSEATTAAAAKDSRSQMTNARKTGSR